MAKVAVRQSSIHGLGLFATDLIPQGTIIGYLEGRTTTEDGPYVLWLSEHHGFEVFNELRYINHSDQPNAAYFDDLTVIALRDIQPGEEIVHDYDNDGEIDVEIRADHPPALASSPKDHSHSHAPTAEIHTNPDLPEQHTTDAAS